MSELSKTVMQAFARDGTIVLTERDARDIQRLLRLLTPFEAKHSNWNPRVARPIVPFHSDELHQVARAILMSREARKVAFASSMFGEPAWDILLTLFVAERDGLRLTVSRLAEVSGSRLTTAIRWIEYLEQSGLIQRRAHPHDARVVLIELTEQATSRLETYFRSLLEAGYFA